MKISDILNESLSIISHRLSAYHTDTATDKWDNNSTIGGCWWVARMISRCNLQVSWTPGHSPLCACLLVACMAAGGGDDEPAAVCPSEVNLGTSCGSPTATTRSIQSTDNNDHSTIQRHPISDAGTVFKLSADDTTTLLWLWSVQLCCTFPTVVCHGHWCPRTENRTRTIN